MFRRHFISVFGLFAYVASTVIYVVREFLVTPFVHWPAIALPAVSDFLSLKPMKPEYRESWRTHGLSLTA